jgi:hypothetical protein
MIHNNNSSFSSVLQTLYELAMMSAVISTSSYICTSSRRSWSWIHKMGFVFLRAAPAVLLSL